MPLTIEDIGRSQYSVEQIEAGLAAMAIWHGNSRQASRVLKEADYEIPPNTLIDWKNRYPERFAELTEQIVPQVRERLAQTFEVVAMRSAELTLDTLDEFGTKLHQLEPRDLAGAIRNLSTTGAIGVDKASLLRGLPTEIRKTENATDFLERAQQAEAALRAKFPTLFVEGTAEEIRPELQEGEAPAEGAERQQSRASSDSNAPAGG